VDTTHQIAKHFREVFLGGNWTWSNLHDNLADVTWQEAIAQVYSLNSIAALTYHIGYFVTAAIEVLEGRPLTAHDKFSFDHPAIQSQGEWQNLLDKTFANADKFATLVEHLPQEKLFETFADEKYGNYYRNLHGIIEHTHYHLGQIAVIKKILRVKDLA
jgi:uncharacterized damage-inducible protein DinB